MTRRATLSECDGCMEHIPRERKNSVGSSVKRFWKELMAKKDGSPGQQLTVQDDGVRMSAAAASSAGHSQYRKSSHRITLPLYKGSPRSRRLFTSVSPENILHFAVSREDHRTVESLLANKKVDVNSSFPPGVSALHIACANGNMNCVNVLLKYDANVAQRTWRGLTPIKIAVAYGNYEVAEQLLQSGASIGELQEGMQVVK